MGAALFFVPATASQEAHAYEDDRPTIHYFFSPSIDGGPYYRHVVDKWKQILGANISQIKLNCMASAGHESEDINYCSKWLEEDNKYPDNDGWITIRKDIRFLVADNECVKRKACNAKKDLPAVYVEYDDGLERVTNDAELCEAVGLENDCLSRYFP